MLNTNIAYRHSNTQNVKINAVTGAILKNHPKSWFERIKLDSTRANHLLCEGGHKGRLSHISSFDGRYSDIRAEHDPEKDIVVLQMVICGDMEVLAECVYAKDYTAAAVCSDPIRHGKWSKVNEHAYTKENPGSPIEWVNYYCSECDAPNSEQTEYCPHCGAVMDL